jgi:hypothetical protein
VKTRAEAQLDFGFRISESLLDDSVQKIAPQALQKSALRTPQLF